MPKYRVTVNRDYTYEVEADDKAAAVNKVDDENLTPVADEFQYATATEVATDVTFDVTAGRLSATYPLDDGTIQFVLTEEGLIVDVFDHEGENTETFARTAQEFADIL
jgi:hypothetical protein